MFGSFGMLEILLILVVGVVVFGVIKLPRFAKSVGAGWQELKRLKKGFEMGFDEEEPSKDERASRRNRQGPEGRNYYQQGSEQQYQGQGPAQQWQEQGQHWTQEYGQAAPPESGPPSAPEGNVKKPPEDLKNA
jgi:Sec-independent protein translocase protein TatA